MPFGHPGISAYEYAGVMDRHNHEERAWAKATEQTSSKHKVRCDSSTTTELERRKDASLVVAQILELQHAQAQSDEAATTQRRRGTFVNHTPRSHEVHLSPKLAHQPEPSEGLRKLNTTQCGSSNDNTDTDYSAHHSSYGSPTTSRSDKRNSFTSIKLDCGIPLNPLVCKLN